MVFKKKAQGRKVSEPEKTTSQARLELPVEEFEKVRSAARSIGLSVSAFIRMAVLKEARRVDEGRD